MDRPGTPEDAPLISDRVLVNGTETALTFTADAVLSWVAPDGRRQRLRVDKDVLGFAAEGPAIRVRAIVDLEVACCVGGRGEGLVKKDLVFEPLSDESRSLWFQKLQEHLDSLGRPKKLFIFLNPFGGKGSASKIFSNDVKPLLVDAGVQFDVQETQYQSHAKEVARSMDLSDYDGIVCVSGDGILVEVVNGLLERNDWRDAIKIPLGVIPAGTGNGMAKSLLDSVGEPCNASYATLAIIRGHKRSLDVATVSQGEKKFFSVLMLAWGLIADIDIESEKYRWMGSARLDFYAIQRVLHLRRYDGRISFVPAPGFEIHGEPISYTSAVTAKSKEEPLKVQHKGYQGPVLNLEDLSWRVVNGPFVSIWLHNVPWGAESTLAAPDAKFSDGYIDLIAIRDCPKMALLSLMTEIEKGGHVKSPYVMYLKVKSFILEPGSVTGNPMREGIIDIDGEVLARGRGTYRSDEKTLMIYDKLQIMIDQGLATLFSPI